MRCSLAIALALLSLAAPQRYALAQTPGSINQTPPTLLSENVLDLEPLPGRASAAPFAAPRDAARYKLQLALTSYRERKDARDAVRGLLQAALLDPTYALAVYDLAILEEEQGNWDEALRFLDAATRLPDTTVNQAARTEIVRARAIAEMEQTPDGRQRRKFDSALIAAYRGIGAVKDWQAQIEVWEKLSTRDDTRYEPFARKAALLADHGRLADAVVAFSEAAKRSPLELSSQIDALLISANRELKVRTLLSVAGKAVSEGNADRAAQSFRQAWEADPAQTDAGMHAAGYLVAQDQTKAAAALLARICAMKGSEPARKAEAMLKALASIEPAAAAGCSSATAAAPRFATTATGQYQERLPKMITGLMLAADAPAPALMTDTESVVLLESLLRPGFNGAPSPEMLNEAGMTPVSGEHPFDEYKRELPAGAVVDETPPAQEVAIPGGKGLPRVARVLTTPYGAAVSIREEPPVVCHTPCELAVTGPKIQVTVALEGYQPQTTTIALAQAVNELTVELAKQRGQLLVDAPEPTRTITINGKTVNQAVPALFSLPVGVYQVSVPQSGGTKERMITVVADRQVQLRF